ncbi:hypothetical protein PspLS_12111 [Pyricularia sp. CBS 133598]|nr:hypothetical protein PspLS_12111 [Pyricularia sp. CBS 133598]
MTAEQIEYYQQKVDNWWHGTLPMSQAVDDAVAQANREKPSELMSVRLKGKESKRKAKKGKEKTFGDFYHRLRSVTSEIISVVVAFD